VNIQARIYDKIPGKVFLRLPNKLKMHVLNVTTWVRVIPKSKNISGLVGHWHIDDNGLPYWAEHPYTINEDGWSMFNTPEAS
jgi:hypothetical protein